MPSHDPAGRVCLVTGANRGIGRAITESLLAAEAAKVYAAVRKPASAAPLVEAYGDRVVPIEVDVANDELVRAATRPAADVEIVVNNAGVLRMANALADDVHEALAFEMDVNVHGLIRMARAFAPVLAGRDGAFVQLNSIASVAAFPDLATYCASKAAAYSITQSLRTTLGAQGTRVISVHPGPIATDMADDAGITEMAEPASLVGGAVVEALRGDAFHVWTDTMSRQIGAAYAGFAESVVLAEPPEG